MFCCLVFYSFRGVVQSMWLMSKAPGYNWGYPGFMSIFVGYGTTTDFFYSGHVGICMIHYLEFRSNGMEYMAIFSILSMIC